MSACKNATVASVENLIVSLKATVVEALFQDYPGAWPMACARFCRIRKFLPPEVREIKKTRFLPLQIVNFPAMRPQAQFTCDILASPPPRAGISQQQPIVPVS
jgi:hypothetical protein